MKSAASLPMVTPGAAPGRWWSTEADGRIFCQLCPRACRLKPGDRGFCFVRKNEDGRMVLDTYGRSTGFCVDPIEKKPLNHFYPGTPVLSFGTAGCNLGCKFCQNWDISKSREVARLSDLAMPEAIAQAARQHQCRSVAFTYNDPVIWSEYALDTAAACRDVGIHPVAVTAGYITPEARGEFFGAMDAANIDLKAFSESFYHRLTGAHLQPVLDTIQYVCRETDCWVELTNLIIPQANDEIDEVRRMCDWVLDKVGPDVPVHFTAFHPDFRMRDRPRTPEETLIAAHDAAVAAGLHYVYVGNVHDVQRQSTYCPGCRELLIQRDWYELGRYGLDGNRCRKCGYALAGRFDAQPGTWGQRRQPVRIEPMPTVVRPSQRDRQASQGQPAAKPSTEATVPVHASAASLDVDANSLDVDESERRRIKQFADAVVVATVLGQSPPPAAEVLGDLADRQVAGVYVTLKRGRTLRGCCGVQGLQRPLGEVLASAAVRTACDDPRMPAISPIELPYLALTVSLLGPPSSLAGSGDEVVEAVEIGKHGLRIQMGSNVGLLLPSVAEDQGWDARQFLDAVCRKAGLPAATWRSDRATVERFEGIHFGGAIGFEAAELVELEPQPLVDSQQVARLQQWVGQNVRAMRTGATPCYYAPELPDGEVAGVAVTLARAGDAEPVQLLQIGLRQSFPLQATLFQMAQQLAASAGDGDVEEEVELELAVLSAPVLHGSGDAADLRGVDFSRRAILAFDGKRTSLHFDPVATAQRLVEHALTAQRFHRSMTQIHTLGCVASKQEIHVSLGPQPEIGRTARLPAVAGMFYPADDDDRVALINWLMRDLAPVGRTPVSAIMVPHAGLRFSGRIAADVWRRVALPSRVLIIGPKHTADGVDWAVAPHDRWMISDTASMAGDPELASLIAEHVTGMELDAAAHRREHGIEVQLPLLHQLAPETRVAAIAMHGGDWKHIQQAAADLAQLLRRLDDPPLLVISSDMNHFADDAENRRRDRLALAELERNDPAALLETCRRENISMCGQLPAAFVLLTLQALGCKSDYELIDYGTSADTSGDTSRVVGYAGVIWKPVVAQPQTP